MSYSKLELASAADIIDRWLDNGGLTSQDSMLEATRNLKAWLTKADKSEIQNNWLTNQNTFALWCLIEVELDQCPPEELRDLVFSMRGEHELWFGELLFALAIYLYESKTTPQNLEGIQVVRLHAVIWSEIMLLHSVLTAYNFDPAPGALMSVKFGLRDYQTLNKRLHSSDCRKLPGVIRLLEELMGYGDPVAEFLLGLDKDHGDTLTLIRDASDCGFILASYYVALTATSVKSEAYPAWMRTFDRQEKGMLLRRLTTESVIEYLGKYEAMLDNLSDCGLTKHPTSVTEQDWFFFLRLVGYAEAMLGNPEPGGPASDSWLESEKAFDDLFGKSNYSLVCRMELPSNKKLQFVQKQYELVKRCEYRLRLAEPLLPYRQEYLFNLVVESAKLFEALLKACVICFNNPLSTEKISKLSVISSYSNYEDRVRPELATLSKPTQSNNVQPRVKVWSELAAISKPTQSKNVQPSITFKGKSINVTGGVIYKQNGRRDSIANAEIPKLNDYIFEVLSSVRKHQRPPSLSAYDWGYGVLLTYWDASGVLESSTNVRSLLCAIALTAFVNPEHPFRKLWLPENIDGLKTLMEEAHALYVLRDEFGGAHFAQSGLDSDSVLEAVDSIFRLADKVIEEVLL